MDQNLKIIEVGNSKLQFKFANEFQIQWVETNRPWNFENNLLLLKRWERGMTANNMKFSHSPFWVQIWGLPFDMITEKLGMDIGSSLGVFITADARSWLVDQAKLMRIRVNIPIDKPLRRCRIVVSPEGEANRVFFHYERLSIFCYHCGLMGYDDRRCPSQRSQSNDSFQYGEYLRAQGGSKGGGPKDSPYKAPVSLSIRNYNGELQKERTPEGTKTGDNAAACGGENLGENHNGEKVHLVEVSEKGDNNTQRLDQIQIQKSLKNLKEGEGKWVTS